MIFILNSLSYKLNLRSNEVQPLAAGGGGSAFLYVAASAKADPKKDAKKAAPKAAPKAASKAAPKGKAVAASPSEKGGFFGPMGSLEWIGAAPPPAPPAPPLRARPHRR